MKPRNQKKWFEDLWNDNEKRSYRLKTVLCHQKSEYHEIHIYDLFDKGISLILDGHARVFEIDEFIYHEGFVHSAMARAETPNSILVLGDGDGGLIRELLKYPQIQKIDWVEIDPVVVECCEEHLPTFPKGYELDGRVALHHEDGAKFLKRAQGPYDIVFVSVTADPESAVATPFHSPEIYPHIKRIMTKDALVAHSLDEFSPASIDPFLERIRAAEGHFRFAAPFSIPLPSFGSNWGFILASDSVIQAPKDCAPAELRFYDLAEDDRMFRIPSYLSRNGLA